MDQRIYLIGMMGSGKSTVGEQLADRIGAPFIDTDLQVVENMGRSIPEIFELEGEDVFRREETRAINEASMMKPPVVIGVAGGGIIKEENRALLQNTGVVIWLRAAVSTLTTRVGQGQNRPLLSGQDITARLTELYDQRKGLYQSAAKIIVDTDGLTPSQVVDAILDKLDALS